MARWPMHERHILGRLPKKQNVECAAAAAAHKMAGDATYILDGQRAQKEPWSTRWSALRLPSMQKAALPIGLTGR